MIAAIIIKRDARGKQLYSDIECDEMVLYATSVENVINILQNHQLTTVIAREKKLQEELFAKHQEINQYRESLDAFLYSNKAKKIGVISYTSYRVFVYLNQDAKDIITIDLNEHKRHSVTQELEALATNVFQYKTAQMHYFYDEQGIKLSAYAIPFLDKNNVLLVISYATIFDIIKQAQLRIHKPTQMDFMLYLETTKAGQLINKIIPTINDTLLAFKINLLKLALSKKALLIDVADDDREDIVHILHTISLREQLRILTLKKETDLYTVAKTLFGINKLYESDNVSSQKPLLESLHNIGTLCIADIQFLPLELQEMLAEYIKYGYYHPYKSDQKVTSSVRIMCSTGQELSMLVREHRFSKNLFDELKQASIIMPSLNDLTDREYNELIETIVSQLVLPHTTLVEINKREKASLIAHRSLSIKQLKKQIEGVLKKDMDQKNRIKETIHLNSSYTIGDPELAKAYTLGKKALKEPKILEMLLKKLTTQAKIAEFLDVNRSTIYKRLKQFNLIN